MTNEETIKMLKSILVTCEDFFHPLSREQLDAIKEAIEIIKDIEEA